MQPDQQTQASTVTPSPGPAPEAIQPAISPVSPADVPTNSGIDSKTPKQIRILNAILLVVGIFTILPAAHILWAVTMKQYHVTTVLRIIIIILSYIVGAPLILLGLVGNIDTTGAIVYPVFLPGILIFLAPFIYTFVKPLPRA